MFKLISLYLLILCVFGSLILVFLNKGSHLPAKQGTHVSGTREQPQVKTTAPPALSTAEWMNKLRHPLVLSLLQIVVILITARVFGSLARLIKQPVVVGEIIAGICLGPSLLGWLWPDGSNWLFAADSIKPLSFLSQIGLIFFMFVVGMELDTANIKRKKSQALIISHVSIVFPFFLGVALAYYIYPLFAPAEVSFLSFALFIGIAMSITAFPVLARIVHERKLAGTYVGNLAITCAAADDITAWCILAFVVAIAKADSPGSNFLLTIGLSFVFILFMLYPLKRWLGNQIKRYTTAGNKQGVIALVFIVILLSAWATELIGIHALFGAFVAGIIMPTEGLTREMLKDKVKDISMLLLLPIFFVCVGLNTHVNLLGQSNLWLIFIAIMLVAVGGKLGGSAVAARLMGISWRNAWSIGVLMNTRGLVELVVLNIGLETGILTPEIFTLMVLMALATTFMTGPLLYIAYRVETPSVALTDIIPVPSDSTVKYS